MMPRRRVWALALAALAVVGVALWLSSQRHLPRVTRTGDAVLPGLLASINDVTSVAIARGNGAHVTLENRDGAWIVAERSFPADPVKLRRLLLDLAKLQVIEEKTRNVENYSRLGLEDPQGPAASSTAVTLALPGRKMSLIVGKSPGAKDVYVRVPGAAESFLGSPQLNVDVDPRNWIDIQLVDIPEARIREVEVTPASGPAYVASRTLPEDPLNLRGRTVEMPLAGLLTALSIEDVQALPVSDPYGSTAPSVTVRTFDGLEIAIQGREDGERRYIRAEAQATAGTAVNDAKALTERFAGHEFEIADYRYDGLFRPLPQASTKGLPGTRDQH